MSCEFSPIKSEDGDAWIQGRWAGSFRGLVAVVALVFVLAACSSADETGSEVVSGPAVVADDAVEAESGEEEHDDDDEGHGDEGEQDDEGEHDDEDEHDDEGSGGLGAHEHGSAELSVAWIGSDVVVDLISPTQNVFGFEYEPETDEDLAIAANQTEALTADGILVVTDAAGCELTAAPTTEVEREASHSEITVSWSFSCANPDEIADVDLSALFEAFPGFEDIDAEWVSETGQSSAELSPQQPTLQLES